jgi:Rad3-related DNA helicase
MVEDLGRTITKVSESVRGGILVFFPSYYMMEEYTKKWASMGITR